MNLAPFTKVQTAKKCEGGVGMGKKKEEIVVNLSFK